MSTGVELPTIDVRLWGLLAEFEHPEDLLVAIRKARNSGYEVLDAYTPFPIAGLPEALGLRPTRLPYLVLAGGLLGGIGAYLMEWYSAVIDFPLNIGGRPLHSWPSFIPVTFELTVLLASLSALGAMVLLNRLPQPYHPLFNEAVFKRASSDRFFMTIGAQDSKFDLAEARKFLEQLGANSISEVFDDSLPAGGPA